MLNRTWVKSFIEIVKRFAWEPFQLSLDVQLFRTSISNKFNLKTGGNFEKKKV